MSGCNPFNILSKQENKELRQKKRCERKYDRYVKKCGLDFKEIIIPIAIDSAIYNRTFETNTDVSGLDSIIGRYKAIIQNLAADSGSHVDTVFRDIYNDIVRYVGNRYCIEDSLYFDTTITILVNNIPLNVQLTIGVWQPDPKNITPFVMIPQQDLLIKTTVEIPKKPEFSFVERVQIWLNNAWLLIVVILAVSIVGLVGYRAFKKITS